MKANHLLRGKIKKKILPHKDHSLLILHIREIMHYELNWLTVDLGYFEHLENQTKLT